jgi:hypothetical protein
LKSYRKGYFLWKFPGCSPKMKFGKFLMFPCISASRAESAGILLLRIGSTGCFGLKSPLETLFQKNAP